jgi:hypothetical protein
LCCKLVSISNVATVTESVVLLINYSQTFTAIKSFETENQQQVMLPNDKDELGITSNQKVNTIAFSGLTALLIII